MGKKIFHSVIIVIIAGCLCSSALAEINESCKDKVHNLVESHSPKEIPYPAKIVNFTGTVYDTEQNPTCSNKKPTVLMPGWVKLLGGELHVDRDFDIVKDGMLRMTVKGSNFDDALCLNGTSQYLALPNSFCNLKVCDFIGVEMCKVLQTKGVHTFDELKEKLGFNTTLSIPEPPSLLGISLLDLFSGDFSFIFALETEGQTILELKIPTNHDFLQIGVEDDDE